MSFSSVNQIAKPDLKDSVLLKGISDDEYIKMSPILEKKTIHEVHPSMNKAKSWEMKQIVKELIIEENKAKDLKQVENKVDFISLNGKRGNIIRFGG